MTTYFNSFLKGKNQYGDKMTTTPDILDDIKSYTEILNDYELEFLLSTAVECKMIRKDDGLAEFIEAFEKTPDDDKKAEILKALGNIAMGVDGPQLAGEFLMKAYSSSKSDKVKTKVKTALANYHLSLSQYNKASEAIDRAMVTAIDDFQNAGTLSAKGRLNQRKGDYEGAIALYGRAVSLYWKKEAHREVSEIHSSIGDAYLASNDIESALNSYREALRFAQKTKGKIPLAPLFFRLGELNLITNKIIPAITYFEDCLKDKSFPLLRIKSLRKLAICYSSIGGEKEANELFEAAISQAMSLMDDPETALGRDEYSTHLFSNGKIKEAKELIEKNYHLRTDHFSEKGKELPGSWNYAQLVYKIYSQQEEYSENEKGSGTLNEKTDKALLTGEIVSEVRRLIEMMHHVMDRPKNIAHDYENLSLKEAVRLFKKEFLTEKLALNNWDKNKVADDLGVTLSNLYHHLESLGMNK